MSNFIVNTCAPKCAVLVPSDIVGNIGANVRQMQALNALADSLHGQLAAVEGLQ